MQIPEALIVSHIIFWFTGLWIARDLRKSRKSVHGVVQKVTALRRDGHFERSAS